MSRSSLLPQTELQSRKPARGRKAGALLCAFLCLGMPAIPSRADAGPPSKLQRDQAKEHYLTAVKHYDAAEYPEARAEFEESYQLSHLPDLLFNLAGVCEKMKKSADAADYLESYLKEKPNDPGRKKLAARIQRLREQSLTEILPPPLSTTEPTATPEPVPPPTSPPDSVQHPAGALDATGTTKAVDKASVPWAAFGIAGGGVALLIVGVGLGGAAVAAGHSVESQSSSSNPAPFSADLLATQQHGKSLAAAGAALDVLGVLAIGAGGAWAGYTYYKQAHKKDTVVLMPLGLGMALGGTF